MKTKYINLSELKKLENNPRQIKSEQLDILIKSIKDNPEYFEARPIIVSNRTGENIIIAGNQRFEAANKLKLKSVPVFIMENLTEEKEREIIIRDNVSNGDWDFEALADWNSDELEEWGVEIPSFEDGKTESENNYTKKIEIPTYEPKNEKPKITELYNIEKTNNLIKEIENSSLDKELKQFLIISAQRHIVFDYSKIADLYAHSDKEMQDLMEKSALVIIDFEKAIENGFVNLSEKIANQYTEDYGSDE